MQSVLAPKNHRKTWLLWINQLSPISPNISNVSLGEREALAEALAVAAPGGPVGVRCVDPCNCHGEVDTDVLELYSAMRENHDVPEEFLSRARNALTVDLVAPRGPFPARQLAETNIIVGMRNAMVAHARFQFPRTWALISELFNR